MNLEVVKEDIKRIGHTAYNEDGNTAIICSGDTYNLEMILLRNILKCFGDYKILSEEDYDGYGEDDILVITDLPFETFMAIH